MNPMLLMFAVRSIVRLGRVGRSAIDQWARDAEAVFPQLDDADLDREIYVNGFFNLPDNQRLVAADGPHGDHWDDSRVRQDAVAIDTLFTLAVQVQAERHGTNLDQTLAQGGALMVKQWDIGKGPISPWARIVLTASDIVLDYVAANPAVLGAGGNGEALIAAYARSMADLLPNSGDFGPREDFGERLLAGFLRAGLQTVAQHADLVVSESTLR